MTEQPDTPPQTGDPEDRTDPGGARDVRRSGGGRTEGETAVDDAIGQGTPPQD
jgi:hypothetical protein